MRAVACALGLGLCTLAAPVEAWTEARIEAADAHVDVLGERVRVSLELSVRVDGGWLSHLSLRGLDSGLLLDPDKPPSVLCEDGRKVAPTVTRDKSGQLMLGFPDARTAPRRGRHRLALVYEAPLARTDAAGALPTALWSLPPFVHDLRQARIELWAPAGSAPAQREHEAPGTLSVHPRGRYTTLILRAEHLPRGVPLELAFVRPDPRQTETPTLRKAEGPAASQRGLAAAALCALVLGLLKRRAAGRLAIEHGARTQPVWPVPELVRAVACLVLGALFVACYEATPGVALGALVLAVALCLDRGFERAQRSAAVPWPSGPLHRVVLGRARRARAARLLGVTAWLDATTPAGASLLACAYALALARPPDVWLEALLAATPLFVTATRLQLPACRHDALLAHARAVKLLRRRRRSRKPVPAPLPMPAAAPLPMPSAATAPAPASAADAARRAPDRAA